MLWDRWYLSLLICNLTLTAVWVKLFHGIRIKGLWTRAAENMGIVFCKRVAKKFLTSLSRAQTEAECNISLRPNRSLQNAKRVGGGGKKKKNSAVSTTSPSFCSTCQVEDWRKKGCAVPTPDSRKTRLPATVGFAEPLCFPGQILILLTLGRTYVHSRARETALWEK